jgi:hypothetical protein
MRIFFSVFAGCLLFAPSGWAQCHSGTCYTSSFAEVDTFNTTSVTQQVSTYSTELKGRMQGGTYIFDQTYAVAFTDASFPAHVTQAKSVLTGVGAVSFTGPTQLSTNQSLVSSVTNTVQTGSQTTPSAVTTTYIGPLTIFTGNHGICSSFAVAQAAASGNGCSLPGTTFLIGAGGTDIDTLLVSQVTISQTATTTNTTLTSQVYEIDGFVAGAAPPGTPAPPSAILTFIGLAGLGIYAARSRKSQSFNRG